MTFIKLSSTFSFLVLGNSLTKNAKTILLFMNIISMFLILGIRKFAGKSITKEHYDKTGKNILLNRRLKKGPWYSIRDIQWKFLHSRNITPKKIAGFTINSIAETGKVHSTTQYFSEVITFGFRYTCIRNYRQDIF